MQAAGPARPARPPGPRSGGSFQSNRHGVLPFGIGLLYPNGGCSAGLCQVECGVGLNEPAHHLPCCCRRSVRGPTKACFSCVWFTAPRYAPLLLPLCTAFLLYFPLSLPLFFFRTCTYVPIGTHVPGQASACVASRLASSDVVTSTPAGTARRGTPWARPGAASATRSGAGLPSTSRRATLKTLPETGIS